MRPIKVEKHAEGYVAYPLGVHGVVLGEGATCEEALADVTSAIRFHVESFGSDLLETQAPVLEAFVADAGVEVSWPSSRGTRRNYRFTAHTLRNKAVVHKEPLRPVGVRRRTLHPQR